MHYQPEWFQRSIVYVEPKRAEYFNVPRENWEDVIVIFPNIVTDVEEASKCYAYERYAAAVHHTLMIVEHGLIGLGLRIGVTDPKSGWTAITQRLNVLITKTKHDGRPAFVQQHHGRFMKPHTFEMHEGPEAFERFRTAMKRS